MVYRRRDRGDTWYTRPKLPRPFGRVGPWSTGTSNKRTAESIEQMLHDVALERPAAIEALLEGRFALPDLYVAYRRSQKGDDHVGELVRHANDPKLTEAVKEYRPHCTDARTERGFKELLRLAPTNARLSWLRGKNITKLYGERIAEGVKPNSVYRGLHRAVAELLLFHYGETERGRHMEGVRVPKANDRREVQVEPEQIEKLVEAFDAEARPMVLALILTAVDVKPLQRMLVRHFDEKRGTVIVPDRKTPDRPRRLMLSSVAQSVFRLAAAGKGPDERLFPLSYGQLRGRWLAARDAAGLDNIPINMERTKYSALRIKDLRHLLPTTLRGLGMDTDHIREILGHAAGSKDTARYVHARGDIKLLDQATERLGLGSILKAG